MKKVLFIFPPWIPSASKSPYLAPHLLSTILRTKGHEVQNIDLNNQLVRRICRVEMLDVMEVHFEEVLSGSAGQDANLRYVLQSALAHLKILRDKLNNNEKIGFNQKVDFSNYIKDIFVHHIKTVQDFRDKGLDIIPAIRNEFNAMVEALDLKDNVVCLSCAFGDQLPFTLELARLIRKKSPTTKILLGGAQVSLLPAELLEEISRFKLFNLVFTGYAEEIISEVIENCPDTFFSTPVSGTTATSKMLDTLPFTEFDEIENYEYPMLPVMVNKGCYWGKCSFCDYILMGDLGGFRYISRSVDVVFNEIKELRKRFPDFTVNLVSDAVPPKFYKELAIRANQENFPLRTYSYMINNKNLTEEFFIEAARAKIGKIVFGTESTNDRILELMQKQGRRKDILENFRLAQKHGVPIKVNLIPNYPTTTFREAVQTINDITFFQDAISQLAVFRFYLSANTKMDKQPEDYDLEVNSEIPYLKTQHNGYHSRDFRNKKGMTPQEEEQVYLALRNLTIRCGMNEGKKRFKEKLDMAGLRVRLTNDFKLLMTDGKPMIYSLRKSMLFNITHEDYAILKDLLDTKISVEDLKLRLGDKAVEWFEKFYLFEIVDFAA